MTVPGIFEGTGMPDPGWWEALWPEPAKVLSAVGVRPGMDVVDLCSGDGWFTLQIANLARHVIAIDIDATLLDTTRIRLAESGLTNCTFIQADAYDVAKVIGDQVDHVFLAKCFPRGFGQAAPVEGRGKRLEARGTIRDRKLARALARGDHHPR